MTTFGRHEIRRTPEGRYHCRACGRSWKHEPSGGCAAKRAPSMLDSRSRPRPLCRACFQQPAQRTGLCAACTLDLRSREQAAQERQRLLDRQEAVREARAVLDYQHAALAIRFAGFGTDAEPCQIAVVDYDGDVIFSQFIKPAHPIPLASTRIHGISQAHVARARPFAHSVEALFDALDGHIVITDGAAFITAALERACEEAEWEGLPGAQWVCMRVPCLRPSSVTGHPALNATAPSPSRSVDQGFSPKPLPSSIGCVRWMALHRCGLPWHPEVTGTPMNSLMTQTAGEARRTRHAVR